MKSLGNVNFVCNFFFHFQYFFIKFKTLTCLIFANLKNKTLNMLQLEKE